MHIAPTTKGRHAQRADAGSFAYHFREHVIPRLRPEIDKCGRLLALEIIDWDKAEETVTKLARRYGAEHLPPDEHAELLDWIDCALLSREIAAEAQNEVLTAELAHREATDPVNYYSELATGCRDPERMGWVFAVISRPYRAYLLAEVRRA
jgi:hypothetical protein